jgi:hypothetical protein
LPLVQKILQVNRRVGSGRQSNAGALERSDLVQYELQQSLQSSNESIPDAMKKPTQTPSLRWVYFLFRVVNEVVIAVGNNAQRLVVNVNDVLRKIIRHFGPRASEIYLNVA